MRPKSLLPIFLLALSPVLGAAPLPLEYFLKDSEYLDVSLSPSGERVSARVRVDGRVMMVIVDRKSGKVVGGARAREGDGIYSMDWVNNDRLLYTYAETLLGSRDTSPFGELYGIDWDGGDQTLLAGFRASDKGIASRLGTRDNVNADFVFLKEVRGDARHALVVEYPWSVDGTRRYVLNRMRSPAVMRLNVYKGQQRLVEKLPFRNAIPFATADGTVRVVTHLVDGPRRDIAYRTEKEAEWQSLVDVFDLDAAKLVGLSAPSVSSMWIAREDYLGLQDETVVGINAAGAAAYLRGHYGEEGFRTVYRLDFESKAFEPMFTDLDADIADWLFDPETGDVVAGVSLRGKPRYHYPPTETGMGAIHKKLARAFKGKLVEIVSASRDGGILLVRVSSDVDPGEFHIFDRAANKADFLWADRASIDPRRMRPMLLDEVESEDGLSLPVKLTLPEGDRPAPLVVFPHRGPMRNADVWQFDEVVQILANRGYAVLQVNFRGSGFLGAKFEAAGYRQLGSGLISDIATATRWAMNRPEIDSARVCAYGEEFGAYATMMLAAREPDLLACAVAYMGTYDLDQHFTDFSSDSFPVVRASMERWFGTDKALRDEFSPVNYAKSIKAKTLLFHGSSELVGLRVNARRGSARAMRAALEDAGNEPEWVAVETDLDRAGSLESRLHLYQTLLDFLSRSLR